MRECLFLAVVTLLLLSGAPSSDGSFEVGSSFLTKRWVTRLWELNVQLGGVNPRTEKFADSSVGTSVLQEVNQGPGWWIRGGGCSTLFSCFYLGEECSGNRGFG